MNKENNYAGLIISVILIISLFSGIGLAVATGTPSTSLPFFMDSENYLASDKVISATEFTESPILLNDYGATTEKCGLWDCTAWSLSPNQKDNPHCTGGWNCTSWNGVTCAQFNCSQWSTDAAGDRFIDYCTGGWNCSSWSGSVCMDWNCTVWGETAVADKDPYCDTGWNCTSWNGASCAYWNCTGWTTDPVTVRDDYYCNGAWDCLQYNNSICESWNCTSWATTGDGNKFDRYCNTGWNCSSWSGSVCDQWSCLGSTLGGQNDDYYCDRWNCSIWDESKKVCQQWNCLQWSLSNQISSYCSGVYNCTTWKTFSYGDTAPPLFTFIQQIPADIDTVNLFTNGALNVTYNITDATDVNATSVRIFFKVNDTNFNDFWGFVNGTLERSAFRSAYLDKFNVTNQYNISLCPYGAYPATHNLGFKLYFRLGTIKYYNLNTDKDLMKVRLYNVTNAKRYGYLAFGSNTTDTLDQPIYYCNSSYTAGKVSTSPHCTNFYNLENDYIYNISGCGSVNNNIVPFNVNTTTGMIGGIYVTNTSYFVLSGAGTNANDVWSVHYVDNITRADQVQTSGNSGSGWSNFAGTADLRLLQFNLADTLYYKFEACDVIGNCANSTERYDTFDHDHLPPTAPDVYSPTSGNYSGFISINYTASIPDDDHVIIAYYNITLVNETQYPVYFIYNNSNNLSYYWDSTAYAITGNYYIRVEAVDNTSRSSFGYSDIITIDNTKPIYYNNFTTPSSPMTYYPNNKIGFQINCTNGLTGLYNATFESNHTGSPTNYTPSNTTLEQYWFNITDEEAEYFEYRWICRDVVGHENATHSLQYIISKNNTIYPQLYNSSPTNITYSTSSIWFNLTTNLEGPNSDHTDTSWCGVSLNGVANGTLTNSSGNWNNMTTSLSDSTTYNATFYCNNTNENYTVNTNYTSIVFSTADVTPPLLKDNYTFYDGLATNNGVYHPNNNIGFQVNCTDTIAMYNALFENITSGTKYSMTPSAGGVYYYNLTDQPAGTINYKLYCNDTSGNTNATDSLQFSVIKGITNISLWLNDTESDYLYNLNDAANFTAQANVTGIEIRLASDMPGWIELTDSTTIYNITVLTQGGDYNMTAYTLGNENYSSFSVTHYANISDTGIPEYTYNTSQLVTSYSPSEYSNFSIVWYDNSGLVNAYLENNFTGPLQNTSMSGAYPTFYYNTTPLAAGDYQFRFVANDSVGNTNATPIIYFTINKANINLVTLYLNGTPNSNRTYVYPQSVNAAGDALGGTALLWRDGVSTTNPEQILLGNGTYAYKVNTTGDQNYSANHTGITYYALINQGASICTLSFDPSSPTTYGLATNATCSCSNLDAASHLYRNNAPADSENNTLIVLPAAIHNYTCNVSNGNYSSASTEEQYIVNKASLDVKLYVNDTQTPKLHFFIQNETVNLTATVGVPGRTVTISSSWAPYSPTQSGVDRVENLTNLTDLGTFNFTAYSLGDENYSYTLDMHEIWVTPPDTTPPVRSNGQPTGTLTSSPSTMSIVTNEAATCRYSTTAGKNYSSMDAGTETGLSSSHSWTLPELSAGDYKYYIRCRDSHGNVNTNDYPITFTISAYVQRQDGGALPDISDDTEDTDTEPPVIIEPTVQQAGLDVTEINVRRGETTKFDIVVENTGDITIHNVYLVLNNIRYKTASAGPTGYIIENITDIYVVDIVPDIIEEIKPNKSDAYTLTLAMEGPMDQEIYYINATVISDETESDLVIPLIILSEGDCCLFGICYSFVICWYYWLLVVAVLSLVIYIYISYQKIIRFIQGKYPGYQTKLEYQIPKRKRTYHKGTADNIKEKLRKIKDKLFKKKGKEGKMKLRKVRVEVE